MSRVGNVKRKTAETDIRVELELEGTGSRQVDTGIPFFDHMLTLFAAHGFFNLNISARGDIEVDYHHTVEDIGIVLGQALNDALGDRSGIVRYGHAVTPMDETLTSVSLDLSNRPFLVYNVPGDQQSGRVFDRALAKEFFRALANRSGMNLHINVRYGENEHHILESIFKALGRALRQAVAKDDSIDGCLSTKGSL